MLPSIKYAYFSWTKVYDVATAIWNLSLINGDMVYKDLVPMMFKYTQWNDYNHFGSLAMTLGILESFLLHPNTYPEKFSIVNQVMDYCTEEFDIYDEVKFKNILSIFNIVWATLPTLHEKWGETIIKKNTKMSYWDYLNSIKSEEEKAFWNLYENMEKYAVQFFKNILKMLNFMEKPKVSSGTISKTTSKLSEWINITLQLLIDGMDEEMFDKIL